MRVNDIFFSYQAEGLYIGKSTVFIRFSGCNLDCYYCDEKKAKKVKDDKIRTKKDIITFIKKIISKNKVDLISLTGGEPLMQKDIKELIKGLSTLKKERKFKIYLETNSSIPSTLKSIIKKVDIVALDLKIPLNDKNKKNILKEFKESVNICKQSKKRYFIKLVIGGRTLYPRRFIYLIRNFIKELDIKEIILQPVTEELNRLNRNLFFNLSNVFYSLRKVVPNIYIIPQLHKTVWKIK